MAGTPWNKGLTKADPRVAAAEHRRRAARIYYSPYAESGRTARNRRSKSRRRLRDPLYERAEAALTRARQEGVHIEDVDYHAVLDRHGMLCGICGGVVDQADLTFDHIQSMRLGGPHTEANLQITHMACNSRKGEQETRHLRLPSVTGRKGGTSSL